MFIFASPFSSPLEYVILFGIDDIGDVLMILSVFFQFIFLLCFHMQEILCDPKHRHLCLSEVLLHRESRVVLENNFIGVLFHICFWRFPDWHLHCHLQMQAKADQSDRCMKWFMWKGHHHLRQLQLRKGSRPSEREQFRMCLQFQ